MNTKSLRGERGQAAVLITILLMLALIALTALAIDGGHLYVVRRDLQNMSDAACLAAATELSLQGSVDDAYNAAVQYVLANGGSADLYTEQDGGGGGLVKGIQVSGADVRVALQTLVDTYFTMIFNRSEAAVGARSHCNATAAGGLLPIAVRRFDADDDPTDGIHQRDYLANKSSDPFDNPFHNPPGDGYPGDCDVETWPGRYGDIDICVPTTPYTVTDGLLGDLQTGSIDWENLTKEGEYVGVGVLGGGPAKTIIGTNSGTHDYKGFVLLDMRNIVGPGFMEFYNGVKLGQPNTNKDISKQWFHSGYPGPQPMVGAQLAMLEGASNDFAAQEMAQYYEVGDEFVAIVYSGYIWENPGLELSIEPLVNPIAPTFPSITDTVTYTLTLEKAGPSPWHGDANFLLQYSFMEEGGAYEVITPTVDIPSTVILPQTSDSVSVTMTVYAENPITTTNYLSALTVQTVEIGIPLGLTHWASTNFRYGDVGQDFTLHASQSQFNLVQGDSMGIELVTRGFGGFKDNRAPVEARRLSGDPWASVFTSSPDDTITIRDGVSTDSTFPVAVKDDALPGLYPVQLTVYPGGDPRHSVDIVVKVYSPLEAAELSGKPPAFVIVEGFAPFRVSYKDANNIWAYAIGPICDRAEDLISGLNPRLLPW